MRLSRVQPGEPLTARLWNRLIDQVEAALALSSDGSIQVSRTGGGAALSVPPSPALRIIEIRGGSSDGDPVTANSYGMFQGRVNLVDQYKEYGFTYTSAYDPASATTRPYMPYEDVAVVTMGMYFSSEQDHTAGALAPPPILIHGDRFLGFRVCNTAQTLYPTADAPRPLYVIRPPEQVNIFYNASGETVPSWGLMKLSTWRLVGSATDYVAEIVKPNDTFARTYFVNGERQVATGKCGRFQPGPFVIGAGYAAVGAGPGARCGPTNTSGWLIQEGGYGFRYAGAQPSVSLNDNAFQQDPPEVLLCEATADIASGATGATTYKILDAAGNTIYAAGKVPNLTNRTNTKINNTHKFYAWLSTDLTAEVLAATQKFVAP